VPASVAPRSQCIAQDDARVAAVVSALLGAGCVRVSVVDGGFSAVHDLIKAGRVALRGDDGDATLRRIAVIDHAPRRCPACRNLALGHALQHHPAEHEDAAAAGSSLSAMAGSAAAAVAASATQS